jgi:murein DD-endopeptidase MepM/ murein hydrolase activator NlpD
MRGNQLRSNSFIFLTAIFLFFGLFAAASDPDPQQVDLMKEQAMRDIKVTREILNQKTRRKIQSYGMMTVIKKQIRLREHVIRSVGKEIESMNLVMDERAQNQEELAAYLNQIKGNLQKLILEEYKTNRIEKVIGFILSSGSISEALKRMRYLKNLNDYRKRQYRELKRKLDENQSKLDELEALRQRKLDLLSFQELQRQSLLKDREEERRLVRQLSQEEKGLRNRLARQEQVAKKLEAGLIAAIDQYKQEFYKKTGKDYAGYGNKRLQGRFENHRFRLPWPVKQGYISETYGKHKHPTLKRVYTMNTGVEINTISNEEVVCVFNGKVSAILDIPGIGRTVLIKHGGYFTVYANLQKIEVAQGNSVKAGDVIGVVGLNEEGISQLHFEVWKGRDRQNPELWLARR